MYQADEHSGPVVYSTNQRRKPLPNRQTQSIRTIAYGSAAFVFALFLIILAANLVLVSDQLENDRSATPQSLMENASAIEARLAVFNQIIQYVARQPSTQSALTKKDAASSRNWARQMLQLLPQATGFALMTPDGRVLGEAPGQSLTPQCLTDMTKISQKESVLTPAVHQEPSGITHFDLTAPVTDSSDKPLGMLIASININTLNSLTQANLDNGAQLTLLDGYDNVIARNGTIGDVGHTRQSEVSLAGTHWKLRLLEPDSGTFEGFLGLAIFNISALLLTVAVIVFLMRFIIWSMDRDFIQVKTILGDLANGEAIDDVLPTPRLRETAEIFPAISQIHRSMDKKQQLLEHQELSDKLTGLPNRRQFNIEFARAYDFARRGTPVCVVLMKLSGLDKLSNSQISQVVKILASALNEHSRRIDHAARVDTDKFALLMFGASPEGTKPCLERISRSFRKFQSDHPAIPNERICSINIGYTRIHAHRDGNAAQVLKRAEAALAEAEQSNDLHIIST